MYLGACLFHQNRMEIAWKLSDACFLENFGQKISYSVVWLTIYFSKSFSFKRGKRHKFVEIQLSVLMAEMTRHRQLIIFNASTILTPPPPPPQLMVSFHLNWIKKRKKTFHLLFWVSYSWIFNQIGDRYDKGFPPMIQSFKKN